MKGKLGAVWIIILFFVGCLGLALFVNDLVLFINDVNEEARNLSNTTVQAQEQTKEPGYYLDYIDPERLVVVGYINKDTFNYNGVSALTEGLRELASKGYEIIETTPITARYNSSNPTAALIVKVKKK